MKVPRSGERCDYESVESISQAFLVDKRHSRFEIDGPRYIPIDTQRLTLADGWDQMFHRKLEVLLAMESYSLEWERHPDPVYRSYRTRTVDDAQSIEPKPTMLKLVEFHTVQCPECLTPDGEMHVNCYVDERGDNLCGECGLVCYKGEQPRERPY
jgi:hypothetical protein